MDATLPRTASWRSLLLIVAVVWGASQAWAWWRGEHAVQSVQAHAQPGDIMMFTTTDCPYCARARAWFKAHGVPWRECNIDQHEACKRIFDAQGAPGVPLLNVRGQWRLGFDADWLGESLAAGRAG
ncbi:MAG TPA: glutaredoxin family protein [Candidatus Aquabacterium excrementipullorum]|nr:glutaredoxin family protein [Candidatus Aquabacterium excrementipullorum]